VIWENWRGAFPTGFDPLAVAQWSARSIVGIADYCFRPFGAILLIPIALGVGSMRRKRLRAELAMLVAPLMLAAVAALAGQYPFSGSRAMIFVLPALAVLAAEGLGVILSWIPSDARLLRATAIAIVVVPALVLCGRDLIWPAPRLGTVSLKSVEKWTFNGCRCLISTSGDDRATSTANA
jgi:hypothetical protein